MIEFKDPVAERIKTFILDETAMLIDSGGFPSDPVWRELLDHGTRIWLQGGGPLAESVWSGEMDALCVTAGELLNELKDGGFLGLISEAAAFLKGLPKHERTKEVMFILAARRAVELAKQFGARVNIEIPLFSEDSRELEEYGRRLYQVCPEHILPALPYCPAGLSAAKGLKNHGVPVSISGNCNLRQVRSSIERAEPRYISISVHNETAPAESVKEYFSGNPHEVGKTGLIATDLRDYRQIHTLTGFPVLTITPQIARLYHASRNSAEGGLSNLSGHGPEEPERAAWAESQKDRDYDEIGSELVRIITETIE